MCKLQLHTPFVADMAVPYINLINLINSRQVCARVLYVLAACFCSQVRTFAGWAMAGAPTRTMRMPTMKVATASVSSDVPSASLGS